MINRLPTPSLFILVMLLFSFLACSCGTIQSYPGARLSRENVAIIKPEYTFYLVGGAETRIISVDGHKIDHHTGASVEVLPGRHTLEVQLWFAAGFAEAPATTQVFMLDTKPGDSYRIVSNYREKTMWIIEESCDCVVSGIAP